MSVQCKPLYLESPNTLNFSSSIKTIKDDFVILDETYFYPRGGGQCGDSGRIIFDNGSSVEIIDTLYNDEKNVIKHQLSQSLPKSSEGKSVDVSINRTIRRKHNRLHTALHLITAFIRAPVTGCHIKGDECTIDFDLPEMTTSKENINDFLKKQIKADHPVNIFNMSSEQYKASHYYNDILTSPNEDNLRIVSINGVDAQPCCGTHVQSTSEIGQIECFKIKSHGRKNRRFSFRIVG